MIMRRLLVIALTLVVGGIALAQTLPMVAKPEDQAVIKPLVTAETKAREALNAKIATLPEAKALKDAQDALNKAAESLPENQAWRQASAQTLDTAYKLQAKYQLSSREFKPALNDKGELVFEKIARSN
jgi:hypothetical protein